MTRRSTVKPATPSLRSCCGFLLLGCCLGSKVPAESGQQSPALSEPPATAIAVADFDMADAQRGTDDWSFGLADLFAVELRQCGATLFERQQIRMVLGERRLAASGLLQLRGRHDPGIPDIHYLVTGAIRPLTNQQFHLEVSLVEARTGRNVASHARQGRYPEDLPGTLVALADSVAGHLQSAGAIRALVHPPSIHPARTPEVALLFYKGVAYCLAGQPEMGVTWFVDAQKIAPAYLAAHLWTVRAFEMLGLPDFAAVARRKLQQTPNGRAVLDHFNASPLGGRHLVSVAVVGDPRLGAELRQFQTEIKTALGQSTNLFVADPQNIHALAAEMDLQLTEKGVRDLDLASVLWSTVDALVLVGTDRSQPDLCLIELRDALSGETLFRARSGPAPSEVNAICQELVRHLTAARAATPVTEPSTSPRSGRASKPAQVSNTDRKEFAGLLRYLSENPSDRPGWMRLALFFPWLSGRHDGSYECLIFNRVIAATDLAQADAAHWLSEALWRKRAYGCASSIAADAAVLLERFSQSPEGCYARSALALELIEQKKYAQAAAILLQLADELPRLPPSVTIKPDYWANFHFFTAFALNESGDSARARQFLDRADAVLREHPDLLIHDGNTYQLGVWVNHFPERHPLFGPNRDVRQAVAEWLLQFQPMAFSSGKEMSLEQLELLLTRTKESVTGETWTNRVAFLQRLIEHKQAHPALYAGRITESTWEGAYRQVEAWPMGWCFGNFSLQGKLVMEATTLLHRLAGDFPARLAETRQLAHELAAALDPQVAATCFEAVGEFQLALAQVEKAVKHPSPFPPAPAMRPTPQQTAIRTLRQQKIRLLQKLGQPEAAADYARTQADLKHADADAQWAAVHDAVNACTNAGQGDKACELLAGFVRSQETAGTMTRQSAAARIIWADLEIAGSNLFEATDILRAVVQEAEGKDWGVSLRTGYTKAYDAAITRLAELRTRTGNPATAAGADDRGAAKTHHPVGSR